MIVKPTSAHTVPPVSQAAAGEVIEVTYDAVNDLGVGQTAINASVQLLNARTFVEVEDGATLDTPPITANKIAIRVSGIERGTDYELRIGFEHDPPRVTGEKTIRIHVIEGI